MTLCGISLPLNLKVSEQFWRAFLLGITTTLLFVLTIWFVYANTSNGSYSTPKLDRSLGETTPSASKPFNPNDQFASGSTGSSSHTHNKSTISFDTVNSTEDGNLYGALNDNFASTYDPLCSFSGPKFAPARPCGNNDGFHMDDREVFVRRDKNEFFVCPKIVCQENKPPPPPRPGKPKCYDSSTKSLAIAPMFMLPGVAKAGTSSFFEALMEHPMLVHIHKEINFYNYDFEKGLSHYAQLLPAHVTCVQRLTGDASVNYMYAPPQVVQRIAHDFPCMKFIVLLRDPTDRAYSEYQMDIRRPDIEQDTFDNAIDRRIKIFSRAFEKYECKRDQSLSSLFENCPWYECFQDFPHRAYVGRSLYNEALKLWFRYFPKNQFLFVKSEDFFENPTNTLNEAYEFLNLPPHEYKPIIPKIPFKNSNYTKPGAYSPMSNETRAKLKRFFKPHNKRLYQLLQRDFAWD